MAKTTTHADYTATALTLTTAAQPNITSLGTLTSLTIDGGSSVNTVLSLDSSTANTYIKLTDSNTNEGNFLGCVTDDLTFFTRNSEKMRIDSTGKVGIGTTSPGTLLEIADDTSSASHGTYPALTIRNDNAAGYGAIHFDEGATQRARIEVGNNSGSPYLGLHTGSGTNGISINSSGEATFSGKITADAGIDIDNFNIDGTTIALSSGTMVLDSAGQINLDSGNAEIHFLSAGTTFGKTYVSSGDFYFNNPTQDKDIVFAGDDGGSSVTALTLDMSEAGDATFNRRVGIGASPTYYHDVKVPSGQAGSSQIVQRIWSENQGWAAEALTEYYTDLTSTSYPRAQIGFYRGDTSNNDSSGFIVKTGTSSSGMNTRFKVTATGMVEMPEQPAFHATLSSSQTITSTNTTIAFSVESFDRKSNHSNGVFTAPHAGVYLFGTNFLVYPFSAGVINIAFFKGSSNYSPIVQQGGNGDLHQSITRTCLIECAKDDEITVRISGTGITSGAAVYGSQAEWWGYLVG